MAAVRRIGPGDEAILRLLAEKDPDFDIADRDPSATPLEPLDHEQASAYLSDPSVLHWAAFEGAEVVGFLSCLLLRYRAQPARELLLYEIGVRSDWQRRGIGTELLAVMNEWMDTERVSEVWVGADNPGAEAFYLARGFARDIPATYMIMRRPWAEEHAP